VKGLTRDDNKRAKVELTVPLIWYGKLLRESEPRARRNEEEALIDVV
jgi:hypothetical protein